MNKVPTGCAPHATYLVNSDPLALLARMFGLNYKTAHDEALDCVSYLKQTSGKDHYLSVNCENASDGAPPVVLICYYNVLQGGTK